MRVLHYSLGFPPYRTGGMTRFCMDVMLEQAREGHEVVLLWPGRMSSLHRSTDIKRREPNDGIGSYEIINPLPVPYDEGIADINAFTLACDSSVYYEFLRQFHPNAIHIHTFMGLHGEFLRAARDLGIRIVFTSHDFFVFCSKVTMFRNHQICEDIESCAHCRECNASALPLRTLRLLQNPLYRKLKDSAPVRLLRKRHRDNFLNRTADMRRDPRPRENSPSSGEEYLALRQYYMEMLSLIDVVHYNSSLAAEAYERFFIPAKSAVIPITHGYIGDHRKRKYFSDHLRISYLGMQGSGKGFYLLKEALDEVWTKNKNFELNVFIHTFVQAPYMKIHAGYSYDELEEIMENTDVLIAPNVWMETFGYTAAEALSFGVPVIVSGTTGAKDIIPEGCGIIIEDINAHKLAEAIAGLTADRLSRMNMAILEKYQVLTVEQMNDRLMKQCYTDGTG